MRTNNPVERKSLQEQSRRQMLEDEDLKIPLYADDLFNEEVRKREYIEHRQAEIKKNEELRQIREQEKAEEKSKLIPFTQINGYLLSICAIMVVLGVTSIFLFSLPNIIYSIIGIISTIYIGRRITFKSENFDEVANVLLWNITQTLNDFIEHKINYEIKESYEDIIAKATICMMGSLLFLNSNSIIYGLSLLALILGMLMAIAYRDTDAITCNLQKLIISAIIGLFLKTIISYVFFKVFAVDFFNVVLVNVFVILNMLEGIKIEEPQD